MDQNRKTMRHFYCRDDLWETFETMATDFDCSTDYLINESMRLYARSNNYQMGPASGNQSAAPGTPTGHRAVKPTTPSPVAQAPQTAERNTTAMQRPPVPATNMGYPPPVSRPVTTSRPPVSGSPPVSQPVGIDGEGSGPTLYLLFQGQRVAIDKDQFVIGRGSKTADLAIKDGNISRQHAVILRRNGVYYLKDLGSTNGVEFKGMPIDNKRIDEGDTFHICDFELRFTFLP